MSTARGGCFTAVISALLFVGSGNCDGYPGRISIDPRCPESKASLGKEWPYPPAEDGSCDCAAACGNDAAALEAPWTAEAAKCLTEGGPGITSCTGRWEQWGKRPNDRFWVEERWTCMPCSCRTGLNFTQVYVDNFPGSEWQDLGYERLDDWGGGINVSWMCLILGITPHSSNSVTGICTSTTTTSTSSMLPTTASTSATIETTSTTTSVSFPCQYETHAGSDITPLDGTRTETIEIASYGLEMECKRHCDSTSWCVAYSHVLPSERDCDNPHLGSGCTMCNLYDAVPKTSDHWGIWQLHVKHGCQEWELFAGPGNVACRGRETWDNDISYYDVSNALDLSDCKAQCLAELPHCKGVEYSPTRCELWKREAGIAAVKHLNLGNFTCQRFGWPARYLLPVDGGVDRACRGESADDNRASYYVIHKVSHMEDCRARCTAASICFGLEYSNSRCEIWQRPIRATANRTGFTCLHYVPS